MHPEPATAVGGSVPDLSVDALRQQQLQQQNLITGTVAPEEVDSEEQPLLGEGGNINGKVQDDYDQDWSELPWYRRPSIFWLLVPFLFSAMAFGGIIVPKLNIIISLVCRQYFQDQDESDDMIGTMDGGIDLQQCQIPEIQSLVSKLTLAINLVSGGLSAFTSPRLGALSDRYGRRKFMAVNSIGLLLSEVITIVVARFPDTFSYYWLFLGASVEGICGSFMLAMALAYSYGADCTKPSKRAMVFGAFQGCLFTGIAIGPILGGLLVKLTDNILSIFYAALIAHSGFIVYMLLVIPESVSERRMKIARAKHNKANPMVTKHWGSSLNPVNLVRPLRVLFPTGAGSSPQLRLNLMLLAAIDCVLLSVAMGGMTVILLYAESRFGWENYETSVFVSIVNSTRVTMLIVILPSIITYFRRGQSLMDSHHGSDRLDIRLLQFSILIEAIGYILYSTASSGALFTVAGACAALGGVGSPTVQASLTKHVASDKTGQILGATALINALSRTIAPTIFNLIYAYTVKTVPQVVFICLSSLFSIAFVCTWFIKPHVYWKESPASSDDEAEEEDLIVGRP